MKAYRMIAALFVVAFILSISAFWGATAQLVTPPSVTTIHPNNDLVQVIPNGIAQGTNVYATPAQLKASGAYYKSIPLTGFTFTFGNSQTDAAFRPAGTLATGTVTLAPNPSDGSRVCIFSTQIITALTLAANTGQTINNAATAMTALGHVCYLYGLSNTTWDRVE